MGPLVQCMLVSLRRSFISESRGHSSTYVLVHVVNHMGAARALHTRARVNDYQFSRMFATLGDSHGSSAPKRATKGCLVELLPLSFLPTQCSEMRRTSVHWHGDPARRRRRVWAPMHHMFTGIQSAFFPRSSEISFIVLRIHMKNSMEAASVFPTPLAF